MNEELQGTLNEALVSVIESAASAKDFILAETPEVIEQLLLWKMIDSIVATLLGLAILYAVYRFARWGYRDANKDSYEQHEVLQVLGSVASVIAVPMGVWCALQLQWLKILIAPKVYLLEYAAELVR